MHSVKWLAGRVRNKVQVRLLAARRREEIRTHPIATQAAKVESLNGVVIHVMAVPSGCCCCCCADGRARFVEPVMVEGPAGHAVHEFCRTAQIAGNNTV